MLKVAGGAAGAGGTVTQINTGTGLTGGPITTNGTISLANTAVTAGVYGSNTAVGVFTVDDQGRITSASNTSIAIAASQIVSGVLGVANGGTGLSSYVANGIVYANSTTSLTSNSALTFDGNGAVISVNSTSAGLRVTQTGSGNAILVEDSANPDATPFVVDASGRTLIGYGSPISTALVGSAFFQIIGDGNERSQISISRFSADSDKSRLTFIKSRSATVGTNSLVSNGDVFGEILFMGADGTSSTGYPIGASVFAAVDGTPGTNDMPGRLIFSTTADGASSPTERMRIDSSGSVRIGTGAATGVALSTTVAARIYTGTGAYTDGATAASGTVAHGVINGFDNPSIGASNASVTYTNASTVYIDGAPTNGSNVTITNAYALYVASNNSYFGNTTTVNGLIQNLATKTGNYTLVTTDNTILGNASTGNITFTLPSAVSQLGRVYVLKKVDSTANTVTVATTSAQTIDGQASKVLSIQYDGIQVQSDNANWVVIANTFGRNGTAGSF